MKIYWFDELKIKSSGFAAPNVLICAKASDPNCFDWPLLFRP
jgi:hypothetical protein